MNITESDKARFWAKVIKAGPDDCWLWNSPEENQTYGSFWLNGRPVSASRVSLTMKCGQSPLDVLHRCDNPPCVNPNHLFYGTHLENMRDMIAKGRFVPSRGNTKLTEKQVLKIRQLYGTVDRYGSKWTLKRLGARFGVHFTAIQLIVKRKKWTHI